MATTAGLLTQDSVTSTTANLTSAAASGGTPPYTYQWYRSTTSGFTPGGGNILAGKTALTLADTGLVPNTAYYYKVVATDAGAVAGESAQLAVTTAPQTLSQNSFAQPTIVGTIDQRFDYNTKSAQIDVSETSTLYAGTAVKIVDSAGGVPKVKKCTADSDEVFGFINFDIKTPGYVAGNAVEISQSGNVMYLVATAAIARSARVQSDISTGGGVAPLGADGANIVGWALDKAAAFGDIIRVQLQNPSFTVSA